MLPISATDQSARFRCVQSWLRELQS